MRPIVLFLRNCGKTSSGDYMDLHQIFVNNQNEMTSTLHSNCVIEHPVERGDDSNQKWIDWFNEFLPSRYHADKAIIIDSDGNNSDQIDVVIYDRTFSPPLIKSHSSAFIPAESVYAIFEVKQEINKEHIEYAISKAQSVRILKRTYAEFKESKGISKTEPQPILAGILAYRSIDMNTDSFKSYLGPDSSQSLQFGCCCTSAFCFDDVALEVNDGDASISWFFYKLLSSLQKIGTVPAIDYDAYLKHIDRS